MSPTKTRLTQLAVALGLLALGFAGGYAWMTRTSDTTPPPGTSVADQARKVLYWYDPMAPEQRFDKPGKSPFMDMELLPKYADEAIGGGTQIDPRLQQNVGIRTQEVTVELLGTAVRVPGTLTWDLT
ncbi:efflux transporter periplasmic adaptor subunit, partial [Salmonella enterica subsp. enterica]|nr:efflux transporter periplasmic adaptor subunit [Salmonella enterica subsp. enterica serovar Enteritidis]